MTHPIESRLSEEGVTLPTPSKPLANYVATATVGTTLQISGQLPLLDGKLVETGALSGDDDVERGQKAAKACAINLLAQAKAASDDFGKLKRLVKISVFVASAPGFTSQHLVANGASDFLVAMLGAEMGTHARSAVGVAALPMNASVEIEAIFELTSNG